MFAAKTDISPPRSTRTCTRMRQRGSALVACKIRATWRIGLLLRSRDGATPIEYYFDQAVVCNRCCHMLTLKDVLDDRIFSYVSRQVMTKGLEPPRRKLTTLCFENIHAGKPVLVRSR